MADNVYDASFIGYANCSLGDPTPGRRDFLEKLIAAIVPVVSGTSRVRWNNTLRIEYDRLIKEHRNDVVDQFFAMLTSGSAVFVARNRLRKHEDQDAEKCNWPYHDRHLIAAAVDGEDVTIHVTEERLGRCGASILRLFEIHVNHVEVVLPETRT